MSYELADFRQGKQTWRGEPTPTEPFRVTVVPRIEALDFFRCRDEQELRRHLRGLKDLGLLVHKKNRLTQAVRIGDREYLTAYVVRGPASQVPKRRNRRPRITTW